MNDKVVLYVNVSCWKKPIPDRNHDWEASLYDDPEFGSGTGPTEAAAIEALKDMLEANDISFDELKVKTHDR